MFRYAYRFIFCLLICVGLGGCLPAVPVPASPGASSTVSPAVATQTLPAAAPTPQEATMIPSQPPAGWPQQAMVALATAQLAKTLGIDRGQIAVVEVKAVLWRDASLGCPKPGVDYIRVETPGFNIQLKAGDQVYIYHTDETGRAVRCNR